MINQQKLMVSKNIGFGMDLRWSDTPQYISVQMYEPFQDQNTYFFGNISLSWFFIKYFQKRTGSISFWPIHSGKKFKAKFELLWKFFSISLLRLGFSDSHNECTACHTMSQSVTQCHGFLWQLSLRLSGMKWLLYGFYPNN